jgi:hypothetical protein
MFSLGLYNAGIEHLFSLKKIRGMAVLVKLTPTKHGDKYLHKILS